MSCESEIDTINRDDLHTIVPIYPFEEINNENFNNASNLLSNPNVVMKLDSVVRYRYYNFNPEEKFRKKNSEENRFISSNNTIKGVPPVEPTNKQVDVFSYNNLGKVSIIKTYTNYSDNLEMLGDLSMIQHFVHNAQNNIINYRNDEYLDGMIYKNGCLFEYLDDKLITFQHYSGNTILESPRSVVVSNNKVSIKDVIYNTWVQNGYIYNLDSFKNVISYGYYNQPNQIVGKFYYPKNIFNPYNNLYPDNFKAYLYFTNPEIATKHILSYSENNYSEQIQVNQNGYPEVVQKGTYNDGYRTFYYYSN